MRTIEITYPESLLALANKSRDTFETEAKFAMAAKLYELGRLSSGQAAVLAGISRVEFLTRCYEYGTPTVEWDEDEMAREVADL